MRLLPILLLLIVVVMFLLPLVTRARLAAYIVKSRAIRRTDAGQVRYFCSEQCARLDSGA